MKVVFRCLAVLALAPQLHAGFVHVWGIGEIDDSPALVVATVEGVVIKEPARSGRPRSNPSDRYWEAALRVHRAYSRQSLNKDATIMVRYISYGNPNAGVMNGPIWPRFEKGYTALFPLTPGDDGQWRLVADEGFNLTVPAIPGNPHTQPLASGPTFILGELANTLANGTAADRYAAAVYLREADAWPDGFREVLDQAMGGSDDRWLEVACALLASLGIPQPTIDQLMANPNWPGTGNQAAAWALKKGAKRGYPNRLIRCMLRNMPTYEWGATNRLLEFKDSPLVIHELTISLTKDPSGSIYAAYMLVRNGQRAFLTEALKAAVQLASNPGLVPMNRLQASSALLRDYGTDDQFDIIPATLRRLQNVNEDQYRKLFGSVSYRQNKRELRVAAILIDDRRPGFGNLRYCDVAAATVEKLSGENFGIKQEMTASERDRAVALAAAWLRSHRTTI
jgi:hypothetical protein